jgi:hypothetical protein
MRHPGTQPRLLIVTRGLATLRTHYEDVIAALGEAGVEVHVRYVREKWLSADDYRNALAARGCEVRLQRLPPDKRGRVELLALRLRQLGNLLRYYHPDYRGRDRLREYWFDKAPDGPRRWARRIARLGSRASLAAVRLAGRLDAALPPAAQARKIVLRERPDAVVAVGVLWMPQFVDALKAAAAAGLPTAVWVQSWDNLTNKGLLHFTPDRVFVWNEVQRAELARYHGVPAERVCVTGAQTFDHWFAAAVLPDRAEFCAGSGLDPDRPILLYLASSERIEPDAGEFFLPWLQAVRSSDEELLAGANVLVRPHPTDRRPWDELVADDPLLRVSRSVPGGPAGGDAHRQRFRAELAHAAAAVGLNTSAMIDAAILGRPVCTVELPELADRQRGTVHYEYLTTVGGGFLRVATSFAEHTATLARLVRRDPSERDERSERFVREFVRPHGVDVTAAPVFAQEMLRLLDDRPLRRGGSARAVRGSLTEAT